MKLDFSLDINDKSTWNINTPNSISKKMPFYINESGHFIANTSYYTQRHGQDNFLLIYTLSGSGYLNYNNKNYILNSNQAVIIYCNNYHYYKTYGQSSWNFKWIHFSGSACMEYYNLLNEDTLNVLTIKNSYKFEKMLDETTKYFFLYDIPSVVKASSHISEIYSFLISLKFTPDNIKKYTQHRNEIDKVINYIQINFDKKITLDDLTKKACLSKFYFLRIFKLHMGINPYEYLINFRINKAKELLIDTDFTIREICEKVGFTDYDNFIRSFKKIVGITPLKYRKNP